MFSSTLTACVCDQLKVFLAQLVYFLLWHKTKFFHLLIIKLIFFYIILLSIPFLRISESFVIPFLCAGVTRLNSLIGALMSRTKPLSGLKPGGENSPLTIEVAQGGESVLSVSKSGIVAVTPTTPKGFEVG